MKLGIASRPTTADWSDFSADRPRPINQKTDVPLEELYEVGQYCNAARKSWQTLRDYTFKKGYKWEPRYSRKCNACGYEHPAETTPEFCQRCDANSENYPKHLKVEGIQEQRVIQLIEPKPQPGMGGLPPPTSGPNGAAQPKEARWYSEPDEQQVDVAEKFFKRVDRNGHTLVEAGKMAFRHAAIADDMFIIALQDYKFHTDGSIKQSRLREIFIADPRNFKMVQDPVTQLPGGAFWICLRHRPAPARRFSTVMTGKPAHSYSEHRLQGGQVYQQPGHCQEHGCGMKLRDVWFVSLEPNSVDKVTEYYVGPNDDHPGEVIHASMYDPSYGHGFAPLVSVIDSCRLLMSQERYMRRFYDEEKTPRVVVMIPTKNASSVQAAWKSAEDKNKSQGGTYIPKFTYDPGEGAGDRKVQVLEISKLPGELQYIETREECYQRIGSAFGVQPQFHGNTQQTGLQSSGPSQFQVTTDAATLAQSMFNDKVFPALLDIMGVTDWKLLLEEVEDEDEADKTQTRILKVQEALLMQQAGYPAQERDIEGNFVYPSHPVQQQMDPFGMGGGMGQPPPMGGPPGAGGMGQPPPGGMGQGPPSSPGTGSPPGAPPSEAQPPGEVRSMKPQGR